MKLRFLLIIGLCLLAGGSIFEPVAFATCNGFSTPSVPTNYESITVSTVAIGFTSGRINDPTLGTANYAVVTIESNPIRFRADGTDPTASEGHLASAGAVIEVCGQKSVAQFRMIRQGGADAVAKSSYYTGR